MTEGSDLYKRSMAYYDEHDRDPALQHQVWDPTPWIVDAWTGSCGTNRDFAMREWCHDQFGDESWPIHGRPGVWHRGNATIHGWTWFGFATEEMMNQFIEAWPAPKDVAA